MKIKGALHQVLSQIPFGKSYGGYEDKWVRISLGLPVGVWIPNLQSRVRAARVHDVYHLLTGYPPKNFWGEVEEGFFELGAGCGDYYFAWFINAQALGLILIAPKRCWRAFKRGWNSKSLYKHWNDFPNLMEMEVEALRAELKIQS